MDGITRCPRVPLWPLGGTYHAFFAAYPKLVRSRMEGQVPFLSRGAGWLGARTPIPGPLHILFCGPPFSPLFHSLFPRSLS